MLNGVLLRRRMLPDPSGDALPGDVGAPHDDAAAAELVAANDIYAMVNCVKSTSDSRRGGSFSAPVATASCSNFSACS